MNKLEYFINNSNAPPFTIFWSTFRFGIDQFENYLWHNFGVESCSLICMSDFLNPHTFDKIFNISIMQFWCKKTRFKVTTNKFKSKCLDDLRRRRASRRWGWNCTHTNINTHLQGNAREMCIPYTHKRLSQQNLVQPMRNWERASTKDLRNSLLLAIGSLAHVRIQ